MKKFNEFINENTHNSIIDKIIDSGIFRWIIGSGNGSVREPSRERIVETLKHMIHHNFMDHNFLWNELDDSQRDLYGQAYKEEIEKPFVEDIDSFFEKYITLKKPYPESRDYYYGMKENIDSKTIYNFIKNSKILTDDIKDKYLLYRWKYAGEKVDSDYDYSGNWPDKTVKRIT